jgi:hypothetical protein
MKKNVHAKWFPVAASLGLIASSASAAAPVPTIVYDNALTPLNSYFASQTEFGDQITPVGAGLVAYSFQLEYFASGLSGGETAKLRFYANDGPGVDANHQAPGTLLYESPSFSVVNGNVPVAVEELAPLNVALPSSFTWTVTPSGVTGAEVFGLKLYNPPAVGRSFDDLWQLDGTTWKTVQTPGFVANLGAKLIAVPEPGALTLLGLGAAALVLRRRAGVR